MGYPDGGETVVYAQEDGVISEELRHSGGPLGALLREHRELAGLTQERLAEATGLGVRTIRNLENGRVAQPRASSLTTLAVALALTPAQRDDLITAARATAPLPCRHDFRHSVPAQLPAPPPDFVGRRHELRALNQLVGDADEPHTVVLTGTAGVGKTALALRWARQVRDRFPDGHLFVDLLGFTPQVDPVPPAEVLRQLLKSLGVKERKVPATCAERATLFRSLTADRRLLIVLDNAHGSAQIQSALPATGGSLTVVTSRRRLDVLVAYQGVLLLRVDRLPELDAIDLLTGGAGPLGDGDAEACRRVVARCGRLPLALRIAATRMATQPHRGFRDLVAELDADRAGLPDLSLEGVHPVRAALEMSYSSLGSDAAALLVCLGAHRASEITADAAAELAELPREAAARALDELVAGSLLTEPAPRRYALCELVHGFARELAARPDHLVTPGPVSRGASS